MANLKLNIDVQKLADSVNSLVEEVIGDVRKGVQRLSAQTHAKILELATSELKTSKKKYMDALSTPEEVAPGVWVITLDADALWIEDGLPENFDMKPGLLKNAKTSANGSRYQVIPFEWSKNHRQNSGNQQMLVNELQSKLKNEGIAWKATKNNIVTNPDGTPKIGKIGEASLGNPGGRLAYKNAKTPLFNKINIYQSLTKTGNIRRDVISFRTISSNSKPDSWIHPGTEKKEFMDKALQFMEEVWERDMLPEILNKYK